MKKTNQPGYFMRVYLFESMSRVIKSILLVFLLAFSFEFVVAQDQEEVKIEILAHGEAIRAAFADSDIELITSLHHPDVVKALAYNNLQIGREAVIEGLKVTIESFSLEFIENEVENIYVQDSIAIEQTRFTIRGIPKQGGNGFIFKGRTMVTYFRWADSPTGWATIREIIQPASE